jgi:hypothetical protein
MKTTFMFIKKHFITGVLLCALIVLMWSNYQLQESNYQIKNSSTNRVLASSVIEPLEDMVPIESGAIDSYPHDMHIPFASCFADVYYRGEFSDTYNLDTRYNPSFWYSQNSSGRAQNGMLDVNGDNLPDYVYSNSDTSIIASPYTGLQNIFTGCVYLNNGSGWDKAFQCYSRTVTDIKTGEIVSGEFKGDCAGATSS